LVGFGENGKIIFGHYVNSQNIIRIEFLTNSVIYFFDVKGIVKVTNTSLMTAGDVRLKMENEEPKFLIDPRRKPELEEGIPIDDQIIAQRHTLDLHKNQIKDLYTQTIISNKKAMYVISNKEFYCGNLLNWQQCLSYLTDRSDWMDALVFGLNIYSGIIFK